MSIRRPLLLAAAALFLASPSILDAQERTWRLNVVADAGYMKPVRSLGNNATTVQDLPTLQVIADLDSSPMFGGGLELELLEHGITVRALYRRSVDATSDSRLAICGHPDNPFLQGDLCRLVETTGTIQTFAAGVYFPRGSPSARVRPILSAGLGLRTYDFDFDDRTCIDPTEWQYVCDLSSEIWADGGGLTPFLQFGGGLQHVGGPFRTSFEAQVVSGRYDGGVGDAGGNIQIDLSFSLRVSATVY